MSEPIDYEAMHRANEAWKREVMEESAAHMGECFKAHLRAHPDRMFLLLQALSRAEPGDRYTDEVLGVSFTKAERRA